MDTYTQAREKETSNAELMGRKRQEKSLREFKEVLEDLLFMLRSATGMETVYLYWVNRRREQFVLESKSTSRENVMFRDRLGFDDHFLDRYREIGEPVTLEVGKELEEGELSHYYDGVPVRHVLLLPFRNNGETVAITVLESSGSAFGGEQGEIIRSYINALRNVLNTYLEISDLYDRQEEWVEYEQSLSVIETRGHRARLVRNVLNAMQDLLQDGSVSWIGRSMDTWCNLMNADGAQMPPPVGLSLEQRTLCHDALEKGTPEFAIHFNNNPKRISPRERRTEGASLAIPLLLNDRRQGLFLVNDRNPLIFKESTKHKLVNLVRLAGLKIASGNGTLSAEEDLMANEYGGVLPDLRELVVEQELDRLREEKADYHSWFGLITLSRLSALRTQLRLEELQTMQRDLISAFNPSLYGQTGFIGAHADYVYAFVIQSSDPSAFDRWISAVRETMDGGFQLSNGKQIESGVEVGYTPLNTRYSDAYEVLSHAKTALSQAVSRSDSPETRS